MIVIIKNTIRKLRNSSYWVKSGTLVLVTRVSLMMLGFIGFLILIRYLNKDQFGIWVIFMTITSLIETVRIGFLKSPLMILNADSSLKKDLLYSTSLYLNIFLTLITIIFIVLAVSVWGLFFDIEQIQGLFFLFFIKLFLVSLADHFDLVQETNLDFRGTFQDLLSRNFVFILLMVFWVLFNYQLTLNTLVIFQIIGCFFGVLFSLLNAYIKRIKVLTTISYNLKYIKRYFELGKFTFGSSLISIASRNIDTWMLGALISPAAVALYNPALRLSNIFEIPSSTMSTILLPKLIKKIGDEGPSSVRYYYERSLIYVLMFMIPVIIISFIFSPEIISIVVGKGFMQTSELFRITIFYGLLIPFNRQFTVIMDALGKPRTSFWVIVFTLIVSVVVNYISIKFYGIYGAAYASLLTYLSVFVFTQIYLYRHFETDLWKIISGVIPSYCKIHQKILKTLK